MYQHDMHVQSGTYLSGLLDLPSNRLDKLFIKFWPLEGAVAAIIIWRLKPY